MGIWLSSACGVDAGVDKAKIESHLLAVHRHNFAKDLREVPVFRAPEYASAGEAGLVNCTWPKGDRPTLPLMYADEVWAGVEYEVASQLISVGRVEEGLEIVRANRRRYDGRTRNPFDSVEAGHWYARALSAYALLQACSGARFDAVERVLYLTPAIGGDFRCFLSTATGYGVVGVKDRQPFVEVAAGAIPYRRIEYLQARDGK